MIKIYTTDQIEIDVFDLITDDDTWSFPIDELDYVLENHAFESFVLFEGRLYELSEFI